MFEILRTTIWQVHLGGIEGGGGLDGQLTECRYKARRFWVRENMKVNHFVVSSGERLSWKNGKAPSHGQVLELCADADLWDKLAEMVRHRDWLDRPVRRNRRFTKRWSLGQFKEIR